MERIVIGHIGQEMTTPPRGMNPENRTFVQIDPAKCNGCGICTSHCAVDAIYGEMGVAHEIPHADPCLHCGMCLTHCPEGAIYEKFSWLQDVEKKLKDPALAHVAMVAPSARYAIGETFGLPPGRNMQERLSSALKRLGFDHCWDLEFAADVTIWEEGSEFLERLDQGGEMPMLSSCCPAWARYVQTFYPELLPYCTTAKSPMAINGRLAKTYGAQKFGYEPSEIYTVAMVPCIAKKYEALLPELEFDGLRDIDAVLTVRELGWLLHKKDIDLTSMSMGLPDSLMGESACGTLFGVGGVATTLARFAYEKLTGLKNRRFSTREIGPGMREISFRVDGRVLKLASVLGASHFASVCEKIKRGESPYHFIEFMACPHGCINGGGMPLLPSLRNTALLSS